MDAAYLKEVKTWRDRLDANMRRENGWLALIGLFWLEEGKNAFGSGADCPVQLPAYAAPALCGYFELSGETVRIRVVERGAVRVNGQDIESIPLLPDVSGTPTRVTVGPLTMVVIQRGSRMGIRLWDNNRPERRTFTGRQWFEPQDKYRIVAHYTPYPNPKPYVIQNTIGDDLTEEAVGEISFELDGHICKLVAFGIPNGGLSIMFRDATNGSATYPAGRYLEAEIPDKDHVMIDFNMAYNPPCAFTDFATCPLPSASNSLPVVIDAGEKYIGHL